MKWDLGFVKMRDIVKLDQPPYKFRDGLIKPTKENPSSGVYAVPIRVGLEPKKNKQKIIVSGKFLTPLSANEILIESSGNEIGWHPDPTRDCKSRPHLKGSSPGTVNYFAWVEFDKIFVYKKPEHKWKITSEKYNDEVIVEVVA